MTQYESGNIEPDATNSSISWEEMERILNQTKSPDPRYADPKFTQPPKKPYIRRDDWKGERLYIRHTSTGITYTTASLMEIVSEPDPICTMVKEEAEQVEDKLISIHECHLHQVVVTWLK